MASQTYVDTVIYSLAGENNTDYMKTIITGSLLSKASHNLSRDITDAQLGGPSMNMRKFFRWAKKREYTPDWLPGIPKDSITIVDSVSDPEVVTALHDAMSPYDPGPEYVLYTYSFSDNYVLSEALIDFWNDNNSEYRQGDYYPLQTNTHVQFWRLQDISTPESQGPVWGDPVLVAEYPIKESAAGNTYRHFSLQDSPVNGDNFVFVYRIGSGYPELEFDIEFDYRGNEYFPLIPLRLNNVMIDEPDPRVTSLYPQVEKAFKTLFGQDVDELLDSLKDNESLSDLDFVYSVFAAPLNAKQKASKNFIFEFFDDLHTRLSASGKAGTGGYISARFPSYQIPDNNGGMGTWPQGLGVRWQSYEVTSGTGSGWAEASSGHSRVYIDTVDKAVCHIEKQLTANTWKRYSVRNFSSEINVFNGIAVITSAYSALMEDNPEEPSGFMIPISHDVFKKLPLTQSNQLSLECNYLLICCYKVVKRKWYQTGLFRFALLIAIVVVTVVTGGVGAAGVGLLGTNLAVGTALGMVGMSAVIAGAVANAIAAVIIGQIMNYALTELFGADIAMIINLISMVYTMAVGGLANLGGSLANAFENLLQPQNLLMLTSSVGNVYAQMLNQDTLELQKKTQQALEDYTKQAREIAAKEREMFGGGTGFNPQALVGAPDYFLESSDSFLSRTLMTGIDIAEMSNNMLSNYCDATLSTELT